MPTTEAKPGAFATAALAAGGLLMSAFSRGGPSVRPPAKRLPESAAPRRRGEREAAPTNTGERGRTADSPTHSLGAVIGFMTWIWLSSTVVLVGAELNAEMEHQTARDTTTGPERPLGARGARMADQVAG